MSCAGAEKHARSREVDRRRDDGHGEPDPDVLQRLLVQQALDGRGGDRGGGDNDQRAFEPAREIFGLAVTVRMAFIGRLRRNVQRHQCCECRDEVDDRFERIGKQPHRSGDPPGKCLQRDHDDRGGNRQPGVANERGGFRHHGSIG